MKEKWYSKTEAILFDYKTLDSAIRRLSTKGDDESYKLLKDKQQLKADLMEVREKLKQEDVELIDDIYGQREYSPIEMQQKLCCSEATFYRKKRIVLLKVARYLGFV